MKRTLSIVLCMLAIICLLGACSRENTNDTTAPLVTEPPSEVVLAIEAALTKYGEETAEETVLLDTSVNLPDDKSASFAESLRAIKVTYPYGDIINLEDSYARYLARTNKLGLR